MCFYVGTFQSFYVGSNYHTEKSEVGSIAYSAGSSQHRGVNRSPPVYFYLQDPGRLNQVRCTGVNCLKLQQTKQSQNIVFSVFYFCCSAGKLISLTASLTLNMHVERVCVLVSILFLCKSACCSWQLAGLNWVLCRLCCNKQLVVEVTQPVSLLFFEHNCCHKL